MALIVGGVGGGGDVGLAAILVEHYGLQGKVSAVVSFARCKTGKRGVRRRVAGALVEVAASSGLGRRVFEDKLPMVAGWARRVYLVCTEDPWNGVEEAMDWVGAELAPGCSLHADIGGDALLLGYEEGLGSYRTDAVARAAIAYAARRHGIQAFLAVGAAGAEGGGGEIALLDLAATLSYMDESGAILAAVQPSLESLWIARALLRLAESGMLPLYVQAVEGRKTARVDMAYLHGEYRIEPWYSYAIILDASRHCELSPLCKAALGRGVAGISRWSKKRPDPPPRLSKIYRVLRRTARQGGEDYLRWRITSVIEKHAARKPPLPECGTSTRR